MRKMFLFIFCLICTFSFSIVFADNEIVVQSMTPVYDENSGVIVTEENGEHNVIFNDRNQSVKYNIVLKNNTNKDIPVDNVSIPIPEEDFLKYELTGLNSGDVISANSTKEVAISLETIKTEGWGRNFDIDLTTSVSFDEKIVNSMDIVNPNTGVKGIILMIIVLVVLLGITLIVVNKSKFTLYIALIFALSFTLTIVKAQNSIILPITINVSFESKNVMKPSSCQVDGQNSRLYNCVDFWSYNQRIKNIYIENEMTEITDYAYKFDVSEMQNGKVVAFLLSNEEHSDYYDLFIQADGIIYANEDASFYFGDMHYLDSINNLEGFDTSNVADMSYMFYFTGCHSDKITLDLSVFDTGNVTDMQHMFHSAGCKSHNFLLNVDSFDTSNVTNMSYMFFNAGYSNPNFKLDVSNFDTSNVVDMSSMFFMAGFHSKRMNFFITIKNPNVISYVDMFASFALEEGAKVTVNYTSETSDLVDQMIATKSLSSKVVKGVQVD